MICKECGHNNSIGSVFCENCGTTIKSELPNREASHAESNLQRSPAIVMGEDGIMRWVYEMNMWKNPTILITIWKVLLLSAFFPALLVFFLSLGDGFGTAFISLVKILAIVAGIVTGLMLLAYPLVAMMNGGKYCVIFEMDDKSVKHIQMQKQFQKSQVLSMITILAGALAGNIQAIGAGMLAGSKQSSLSSFEKVKSITVNEKRHVIYVNEKLSHNQVYAYPDDFAYVRDYIISHCKKAKVTNK